ncbi:hypothetical protein BJ980_003655 [Nocardioides daedukensis]|uniref:Septum formation-related domain-containing protein n=1 Tax=Nocardioides daedukensis TaxID=634462 RepID=A0A7Y9URS9_9ACTN|nr:hypothetical protein [Nocardioides daedukensis]
MLAVVCGLLVLSGCAQDSEDPEPLGARAGAKATGGTAPELDPLAGAPSLGACYALQKSDTLATTSTRAALPDCDRAHTSRTFLVETVPEGQQTDDFELIRSKCEGALPTGTGLNTTELYSSIVTWIWFEPTSAQKKAGARWFRCDAIAQSREKLKPLPRTADRGYNFFIGALPKAYKRCIRDGKDTNGDGEPEPVHVTCAEKHQYEWTGYFRMKDTSKFPSDKAFMGWAKSRCTKVAGTAQWWATWPSERAWSDGERRISCYAKVG